LSLIVFTFAGDTTTPVEPTKTTGEPLPTTKTTPEEPTRSTGEPTKTVEPTKTTGEPTKTEAPVHYCPSDVCKCTSDPLCGVCYFVWKDTTTGVTKTEKKCVAKDKSPTETGEAFCKRENGVWYSEYVCDVAATTKTTEPEPTKPVVRECWMYTDVCSCIKNADICGSCTFTWKNESTGQTYTKHKCVSHKFSETETGEAFCKRESGAWTVGPEDKCAPPVYREAEVKGVVEGTVDTATKTVIENVIKEIIADKLGVDPTKVEVSVTTTSNSDGTSSFKVTIKVGSTEVTSDKFTEIEKISTSDLEAQLASQGVTTRSGSVNIQNQTGFVGKLIAPLLSVVVAYILF
jgi:hypothetical protein